MKCEMLKKFKTANEKIEADDKKTRNEDLNC